MRFNLRRGPWLLPVVVTTLVIGGAISYATIPDSGGVIHTCLVRRRGLGGRLTSQASSARQVRYCSTSTPRPGRTTRS